MNLYSCVEAALFESDPSLKSEAVARISDNWTCARLERNSPGPIAAVINPGRPEKPVLVDPRQMQRRSFATPGGRICLLHAIAHIEFNAINIALDAVYRYREMPDNFVSDWLSVAVEEAVHFNLLNVELIRRGSFYGAYDAHQGLWDMVCETGGDILHRMALVPRVMEARGLDVTPGMIKKFEQVNDCDAISILETIYRDEIGHVRIGNYWYRYLCEQRGVEPRQTFQELVNLYLGGKLRGPFNWAARIEAGFEKSELESMERAQ